MSIALNASTQPRPVTDGDTTFDAAVRTAAEMQTARLREFGLHVERSEHDAYRRLITRLSV